MKLKTIDVNGTTYAEVRDGHPVYVHADGKEVAFDAPHAVQAIKRISDERDEARKAEDKLKLYGDLDPEKAKKAAEVLRNLDDKKLLDAGKVEELVAQRLVDHQKLTDAEKAALAKERDDAKAETRQYLVGSRFATSETLKKTVLPADAAESLWGQHFKVENGQVVGYRKDGSKIYARDRPAELASFDEALEQLIDSYPNKNQILRSAESSGGGATGSTAAPAGKKRSDMTVAEKSAYIEKHGSEAYLALQ